MRVPEQSVIGTLAALIALGGVGLAGCAASTPIEVTWDEREDLARFRTWDWIDGDAVLVRAPFGDDAETEAQLSALLASALRERGLEHSPGSGELRVAALMVGVRSYQVSRRGARRRRSTPTTTSAGSKYKPTSWCGVRSTAAASRSTSSDRARRRSSGRGGRISATRTDALATSTTRCRGFSRVIRPCRPSVPRRKRASRHPRAGEISRSTRRTFW